LLYCVLKFKAHCIDGASVWPAKSLFESYQVQSAVASKRIITISSSYTIVEFGLHSMDNMSMKEYAQTTSSESSLFEFFLIDFLGESRLFTEKRFFTNKK
jgi:hypothetical protein